MCGFSAFWPRSRAFAQHVTGSRARSHGLFTCCQWICALCVYVSVCVCDTEIKQPVCAEKCMSTQCSSHQVRRSRVAGRGSQTSCRARSLNRRSHGGKTGRRAAGDTEKAPEEFNHDCLMGTERSSDPGSDKNGLCTVVFYGCLTSGAPVFLGSTDRGSQTSAAIPDHHDPSTGRSRGARDPLPSLSFRILEQVDEKRDGRAWFCHCGGGEVASRTQVGGVEGRPPDCSRCDFATVLARSPPGSSPLPAPGSSAPWQPRKLLIPSHAFPHTCLGQR